MTPGSCEFLGIVVTAVITDHLKLCRWRVCEVIGRDVIMIRLKPIPILVLALAISLFNNAVLMLIGYQPDGLGCERLALGKIYHLLVLISHQ